MVVDPIVLPNVVPVNDDDIESNLRNLQMICDLEMETQLVAKSAQA